MAATGAAAAEKLPAAFITFPMDALIECYFTEGCPQEVRTKIYAYIAVCGLLWSNWCEYKSRLGVEFGEYSLKQYRYAKDYYKLVKQELAKSKGQEE